MPEQRMREKILFPANVPVECVMEFDDPKVFPSQFRGGDDSYMYSLEGYKIAFVAPLVERKRVALKIGKGEPFTITRIAEGRTTKNWDVRRVSDAAEPSQAPRAVQPPSQTAPETAIRNGQDHSNGHPNKARALAIAADLAGELGMVRRDQPAWMDQARRQTQQKLELFAELCCWAAERFPGGAVCAEDVRAIFMNTLIAAEKGAR